MFCSVYFGSSKRINIHNNISLDFLKVSSLNEDLRKRGKQLASANNEVITSLRLFDYCNYVVQFTSTLNCNFYLYAPFGSLNQSVSCTSCNSF